MGKRLELQARLENLLGSRQVYFQPPSTRHMDYPAIIYRRDPGDTKWADDVPYAYHRKYVLVLVYKDPDTDLIDKLRLQPWCRHVSHYVADNLYHDVFELYY